MAGLNIGGWLVVVIFVVKLFVVVKLLFVVKSHGVIVVRGSEVVVRLLAFMLMVGLYPRVRLRNKGRLIDHCKPRHIVSTVKVATKIYAMKCNSRKMAKKSNICGMMRACRIYQFSKMIWGRRLC